ncbi:MAG TPA: ferrous iron transport protein B [Acidimicrobiia bacterium]|nr:ferrous iron transport protein B [Acidimicrobiia bacterium]
MTAAIAIPEQTGRQTRATPLRVALVGNPNAGKSTLFNALTGLRQHVANFPGVTVERVEGEFAFDGQRMTVTDLPGTYSLAPQSLDERIAIDVLLGRARGVPPVDVTVLVVDAENLERHLFFASEVLELGRPTVIALNRMDRLAPGTQIDVPELIHELGAVVIPIVASRGEGIDALRRAIALAPTLPPPSREVVTESGAHARYAWIAGVMSRCVVRPLAGSHRLGDRVDAVTLHPVWGPLIFLGIMLLLFQTMFTWSRPLIDVIQWAVTGAGALASTMLPQGELRGLVSDGVIAGVGNVLVFLPQIAILFLFIGILEDTGYMARAAFVMDRFMRPVGLHGRSFIPLLSGYACAVPAILATRTIKDQKQRLATVMVVPLMSCSARLPVYALLIGAFVPPTMLLRGTISLQGVTLLAMYLLGTIGALAMAALFRSTLLRAPTRALILELPAYSMPNARGLAMSVWQRVRIFLRRAGTVILAASVLLWGLAHYPRSAASTADARLAQSALGRVGHAIEPAMRPLGYDWKIGVSILSSFAAREVFVSAMSTIYGVEDNETNRTTLLRERLRNAHSDLGAVAYTPLVALSLMAFYVFALMCTSTIAVTIRECGGGWAGVRWAALQFAYMLGLAYGVALLVYQIGLRL